VDILKVLQFIARTGKENKMIMKTNLLGLFIRNKKSNVNYYFVSYVYSKIGEVHFASTNIRVDGVFSLRQVKELIELH
jgi:hypothetical protein